MNLVGSSPGFKQVRFLAWIDPEENDSEERTYDETLKYILLPFPTLVKHGFRHNHFPYQEVEVFCNCLMPETYCDMIQCDECEELSGLRNEARV